MRRSIKKRESLIRLSVVGAFLLLSGCATFSPSREALQAKPDLNAKTYESPVETCWLALKQVFLKNNYTINMEDSQSGRMQAVKHFDKGALSVDLCIQANFIQSDKNTTQIYLNAVQTSKTTYATRKTLFLIPLPGTTRITQATKEGTIEDKNFYEAFFNAIEAELKNSKQAR
jgi:hypothetical protein